MKSHVTIKRSKDGKYFTLRLWLNSADASHYAWAGRKVWTEAGFAWQRSTDRGATPGKRLGINYAWECRRKDCAAIRQYYDLEPGEEKIYLIEIEEMIFVKSMNPVTMEALSSGERTDKSPNTDDDRTN